MSQAKYNRKLLASGALLALSSSLCCIVPLLALLGTTGSALSAFSWVAPLRPYLLAATAVVLVIAFYQAYKPAKMEDDCGCTEKRNWIQSKTFLWTVTVASIGLSTFPYYASFFQKDTPKQLITNVRSSSQTIISIEGMSCSACEGHVNQALLQQKGVQQVTTSYEKGRSTVQYDSTQISLKQLAAAIEKGTGYKVIN